MDPGWMSGAHQRCSNTHLLNWIEEIKCNKICRKVHGSTNMCGDFCLADLVGYFVCLLFIASFMENIRNQELMLLLFFFF